MLINAIQTNNPEKAPINPIDCSDPYVWKIVQVGKCISLFFVKIKKDKAKARVEVVDRAKKRDLEIIGGGGHRGSYKKKDHF